MISGCIGHVYVVPAVEVVRAGGTPDRRVDVDSVERYRAGSVTNFSRQPAEQNL